MWSPAVLITKHLILFITTDSVSHWSKINILGETLTDAPKHAHNLPLIQNTPEQTENNSRIFSFSFFLIYLFIFPCQRKLSHQTQSLKWNEEEEEWKEELWGHCAAHTHIRGSRVPLSMNIPSCVREKKHKKHFQRETIYSTTVWCL